MNKSDRKRFGEIVARVAIACSRELTEAALGIYFEVLEDLTIEEIAAGSKRLLKTWEKPGLLPTPAQFREVCLKPPRLSQSEVDRIIERFKDGRTEEWDVIFQRELGVSYQAAMNVGLAL